MRYRYLFLVPLLAACDTVGPEDWTHEGTITSASVMVTEVDQYSEITCEVAGKRVDVWTGPGADGAHCLKRYSQVTQGDIVVPVHTLYIEHGTIGRRYRVRVE